MGSEAYVTPAKHPVQHILLLSTPLLSPDINCWNTQFTACSTLCCV